MTRHIYGRKSVVNIEPSGIISVSCPDCASFTKYKVIRGVTHAYVEHEESCPTWARIQRSESAS